MKQTIREQIVNSIATYFPKLGTSYDMQHTYAADDIIRALRKKIEERKGKYFANGDQEEAYDQALDDVLRLIDEDTK